LSEVREKAVTRFKTIIKLKKRKLFQKNHGVGKRSEWKGKKAHEGKERTVELWCDGGGAE